MSIPGIGKSEGGIEPQKKMRSRRWFTPGRASLPAEAPCKLAPVPLRQTQLNLALKSIKENGEKNCNNL